MVKGFLIRKVVDIKEYDVEFKFWRFLKLFFYILSFFFFGWLFALILMCIEGKNYVNNLGYISNKL